MKYPRLIVSLALAGCLASGASLAQSSTPQPQPAPPQPQQSLPTSAPDASSQSSGAPAFSDLSKDGKGITRSDIPKDNPALKEMRAHFSEADKDHNGRIDAAEYNAYVNKGSATQQQ
ncbi:hypothetical protein L2Y96_15525 [Luteibacter aegosomaticola]|uniref:hypothetical protein n=1 Tax=Luteibacter aegosomaticola TaxID=2911538 RepID=UPI001FF79D84|nr:hypothetical protein [Luteibacter aegosomaticola]UPG88809.1 hypothetical protein L2Y96_15525 [Luteibacter aegosomaticola]